MLKLAVAELRNSAGRVADAVGRGNNWQKFPEAVRTAATNQS